MFPIRRRPGSHLAFFARRLLRYPEPAVEHLANHWSSRRQTLPPDVDAFLKEGSPPIVVSLGSLVAWSRPRLFDQTIRACLDIGERIIGIVGSGHGSKHPVASVLLVEGVPPSALAQHAKVMIHHGGINTTQETLANGKPSLCLPQALDQVDNAVRLEWLGVGKWIDPFMQERGRIAQKLRELLDDKRYGEAAGQWVEGRFLEDGLPIAKIGDTLL